jgi:sortase A
VQTAAVAPPAPATPAVVRGPVDPPLDPYQKEPIVRIGTVEIPALGLVHPIYDGISLTVIDNGPSHWPGTAMPGQPGNTVFAGHRVTHSHPFRDIDRLVAGDQVIFTIGSQRSVYLVTGHSVVTPSQTEIVTQTADATGTLFACHPPHSAKYRYVVHLKLTS